MKWSRPCFKWDNDIRRPVEGARQCAERIWQRPIRRRTSRGQDGLLGALTYCFLYYVHELRPHLAHHCGRITVFGKAEDLWAEGAADAVAPATVGVDGDLHDSRSAGSNSMFSLVRPRKMNVGTYS